MKATLLYFCVLILTAMMPLSFAKAGDELQRQIEDVQTRCPRLNCPSEMIWVVSFPAAEQKKLTKADKAELKGRVLELIAEAWPEAILQDELLNSNRIRIDKIEKLVIEGQHSGYRVSYSDKAWELNTCDYQPGDSSSLKDCKTGRIFESAFMALDFDHVFPDAQARATFQPDHLARK